MQSHRGFHPSINLRLSSHHAKFESQKGEQHISVHSQQRDVVVAAPHVLLMPLGSLHLLILQLILQPVQMMEIVTATGCCERGA